MSYFLSQYWFLSLFLFVSQRYPVFYLFQSHFICPLLRCFLFSSVSFPSVCFSLKDSLSLSVSVSLSLRVVQLQVLLVVLVVVLETVDRVGLQDSFNREVRVMVSVRCTFLGGSSREIMAGSPSDTGDRISLRGLGILGGCFGLTTTDLGQLSHFILL